DYHNLLAAVVVHVGHAYTVDKTAARQGDRAYLLECITPEDEHFAAGRAHVDFPGAIAVAVAGCYLVAVDLLAVPDSIVVVGGAYLVEHVSVADAARHDVGNSVISKVGHLDTGRPHVIADYARRPR